MNYIKITLLISTCISLQADVLTEARLKLGKDYIAAKNLERGQLVESLDKSKSRLTRVEVTEVNSAMSDSIVEVELGDRTLRAAPEQTFFDPVFNKWVIAKELTNKNHLLADDMSHKAVTSTKTTVGKFPTLKVSVDGSRYMFVDGVLTHNFLFIPAVLAFLGWMKFGKKKGNKWVVDVGSGHNGSIAREHGKR